MVLAIVQARLGSSRLPAKVLTDLGGQPVLWHVVERLRACTKLDQIVVATTIGKSDHRIVSFCSRNGVSCFRGSEDDVLDRYYRAAEEFGGDPVVRITADCPLIDPGIVDEVVSEFQDGDFDYYATDEKSYPDGLDCEVFSYATLHDSWLQAHKRSDREHVTPYIVDNPGRYRIGFHRGMNHGEMRWTLDRPEDLRFLRRVFEKLGSDSRGVRATDVLQLLKDDPELARINSHIERNEGFRPSLEAAT